MSKFFPRQSSLASVKKIDGTVVWVYVSPTLCYHREFSDVAAVLAESRFLCAREVEHRGKIRFEALFEHPRLGLVGLRRQTIGAIRKALGAIGFPNPPRLVSLGLISVGDVPNDRRCMN